MDARANFGPYAILRAIAESEDSVSFAARYLPKRDANHILALKVLRGDLGTSDAISDELTKELRLAVRLNHVNVAQVFDYGRTATRGYIAQEFVDGVPVALVQGAVEPGQKAVTTEVAAFVCAEACAGLAYAHGRRDERGRVLGIVHTRVTPRTVLLSKSGLVKVVDFGIARVTTEHAPSQCDPSDLHFLAPEIVRGDDYDERADIFSVGAIGYYLLTGRPIYGDETGDALREKAERGYVPALRDVDDTIPEELAELIDQALSADPEARFETATDLRSGLAAWLRRNSPGFGRHRLKNYLQRLLPDSVYGILPGESWESLHRKSFRVHDADSRVADTVQADDSVPSEKDDIEPLLDNPDVPTLKRLDVSAMDTGAHRMVRGAAFAAARARGSASRVVPGARSRIVRTPPPMATVPELPTPAAEPTTEPRTEPAAENTAQETAQADAAAETTDARVEAPSASPAASGAAPTPVPEPVASEPKPASDPDADADGSPKVEIPTHFDEPSSVEIDPTMVYDDSIDPLEQRAAVAEAEARVRAPVALSMILGWIFALLVLGGLAYGVKWTIDQESRETVAAAPAPSIFVTSRPQGAEILLNGAPTGRTTPASLRDLPASAGEVSVSMRGFDPAPPQSFDPANPAGQLAFTLEPSQHTIRINSEPTGAEVVYDGEVIGTTPTSLGPMRVDYRRGADLVLRLDGYIDDYVSVDWAPGEVESSVMRQLHADPNYVAPEGE